MADIIKLDEYLEEHRHNILVSIVEALGMNSSRKADIEYVEKALAEIASNLTPTEQQTLEETLTASLEESNIDLIREMLGLKEITWENDSMDYVDVAKGYNFRCIMDSEITQNSFMDWLEEGGHDYLVDNDGRFAIKSANREQQYRISRQVDKLAGRWDRPDAGINVEPIIQKSALTDPSRPSLGEDEKDSTSFKDLTHTMSPFSDETRDEDEDDELQEIADKFNALDEKRNKTTKSAKNRERRAKEKIDSLEPRGKGGAGSMMHQFQGKPTDVEKWEKGRKHSVKKELRKKPNVEESNSFAPFEEAHPLIDFWMNKMQQTYENPAEIFEHMVQFFVEKADVTQELAEEWSTDMLRHYDLINEALTEDGVLSNMTAMPTLARIKSLAGVTSRPDTNLTTVITKPADAPKSICDPGSPKINKISDADEARKLVLKVFNVYDTILHDQQEIFKNFMIDYLIGSSIKESINESELMELEREGKPLEQQERIEIAKMLNKYWRGLIQDIEIWRGRTNELAKVELAILLLKKISQKIGQGLV